MQLAEMPDSAAPSRIKRTLLTGDPRGGDTPEMVPSCDLDIVLTPSAHRLDINGMVTLPPSPLGRETLEFLLRTDVVGLRIEVLEPSSCSGIVEVEAVEQVTNMAATQRFEGHLPSPCPPDLPLVMSVEYACGSYENRRWLNLTREFSFSSSYASAWLPTFEHRRWMGTVRYTLPDEMVVVATGALESVEAHDGHSVFTFIVDEPSVFDFVAGTFDRRHREGHVPLSLYQLEPVAGAGALLDRTARMIGVLEEEFGRYPFAELSIVEVPTGPGLYAGLEGAAYPGYFLVRGDLLHAGVEDWILGHELAHFWFPHVVAHREDSGAPAMLDEALAHYGSLRVVEALAGPAAAEQFRREGGREAIRLAAAGFEHRLGGKSTSERWDRIAYSYSNTKGHLVYDMLARAIGRERFQSALHRVVYEHAGSELGWDEFLTSIEEDAGTPLRWFYGQWFDRPGLPILSMDWEQTSGRLRCAVTQSTPVFRLDIPLQIEFVDGTTIMQSVPTESATREIEIPIDLEVHEVRVDPHYTVLHATPEQWAEAEAMRHVTTGKMMWDEDEFDEALAVFREGLEQLPEVDAYGIGFMLRLHIGWLHQDRGRFPDALAEYELALDEAVRPAEFLARLYLNLATTAKELGDVERMVWAAKRVLDIEHSVDGKAEHSSQARAILSEASEATHPR